MLEKLKKMMINAILSLDALLPMLFVYLIKDDIDFIFQPHIKEFLISKVSANNLVKVMPYKIYFLAIIYLIYLLLFSKAILILLRKISTTDEINKGSVEEIEIAVDSFLPSYLGYFFVALSVPDIKIFFLIYLFVYKSGLAHFNPILLILGYKYYYFISENIKNLIISKRKFRDPKEIEIKNLRRINDYTFIEIIEEEK